MAIQIVAQDVNVYGSVVGQQGRDIDADPTLVEVLPWELYTFDDIGNVCK